MKYIAIIETDDYKDFEFFEDGNGKYMAVKDAGATANGGWMPLYFTECEQEPKKTGHWIDNHNNTISCDHCHTWFNKDDRYFYMRYCPYCGAKMVEQESEE